MTKSNTSVKPNTERPVSKPKPQTIETRGTPNDRGSRPKK